MIWFTTNSVGCTVLYRKTLRLAFKKLSVVFCLCAISQSRRTRRESDSILFRFMWLLQDTCPHHLCLTWNWILIDLPVWPAEWWPLIQFSHSVMSDSLQPHEPQYARPPCPSPTPRVYPNPCLLSRWCHPIILSSVLPFSSCPQSFPASGSFQMSQLFTSGGQSFGVSALTSVLPMNTQDWSPLGWTGWISLQSKGLSRVLNTTVQKHQFFGTQLSLQSNSHTHTWLLKKP